MDDGILGDNKKERLEASICIVRQDLFSAGLTINEEKSHLAPTKICRWLGFIINTETFTITVPDEKILKLKKLLSSISSRVKYSAREISKVAGTIMSMKPAVGPIAQILTRNMYFFINEKPS